MNEPVIDDTNAATASAERRKRWNRELISAAIALITGFVVLPLMIFIVGTVLLGPYAGGKPLGVFLLEFYSNLGHGVTRTWFIVLSPYLAFWLVRLSFRRYQLESAPSPDDSSPSPPPPPPPAVKPAHAKQAGVRREPFISS